MYEAVPPRVHKVSLAEYRKLMEEKVDESRRLMMWYVMQPMDCYTAGQLAAMKAHAESQLGRPYMLRGWWKGHEVRGIFCSQLVGDIIAESGKIRPAASTSHRVACTTSCCLSTGSYRRRESPSPATGRLEG